MTSRRSIRSADAGPYVWSGEWARDDDSTLAMAHTGVVITRAGRVFTGSTSEPVLVVCDAEGRRVQLVPVGGVTELHDLTLVEEDGEERLWVADTGIKLYGGSGELERRRGATGGQVLQVDLAGSRTRDLARPDVEVYESTDFIPTAVAVDERRFGGGDDIWVADGYGASLVHRYTADGRYLGSLTGEEGAGRFDQPHDVLVDRRRPVPELYVADRKNQRIQVYDLNGQFKRAVGADFLLGPTQMAVDGSNLVVTDLLAGRVTIIDVDDRLVGHLFANPSPPPGWDDIPDAWPNARADNGAVVRADLVPEEFHSPHGVAVADDGTIYVSEFAIGGRVAMLTPFPER